jgi:hypothetical protein
VVVQYPYHAYLDTQTGQAGWSPVLVIRHIPVVNLIQKMHGQNRDSVEQSVEVLCKHMLAEIMSVKNKAVSECPADPLRTRAHA